MSSIFTPDVSPAAPFRLSLIKINGEKGLAVILLTAYFGLNSLSNS
jgi:hypothetical protein